MINGLDTSYRYSVSSGDPARARVSGRHGRTLADRLIHGLGHTARRFHRLLLSATLLSLAACGGGSGGGGGFLNEDPAGNLTSYTIQLSVVDDAGNPVTQVSETFPARLLVTVREDNFDAMPVVGLVVSASSDFAIIAPQNGQALTNSDGVAELQILSGTQLGADTVTVTAESPAGAVTASVGVQVVIAGQTLGFFDGTSFVPGRIGLSTDSLPFRGSSVLRVAVVDETGATASAPQTVRFTSACSLSGLATFRNIGDASNGTATLNVATVDGLAELEYLAGNCETSDQITASLVVGDSTATASLTIAERDASFIGFVNATPNEGEEGSGRTIIALRETGGPGRPEVATVVFEVLEEDFELLPTDPRPGQPGYLDLPQRIPASGVTVEFALTDTQGGVALGALTAVTDANGLVQTTVRSGVIALSTRVTAQIVDADGGTPSATSNEIVVGTGLPDQDSLSLSATVFNAALAGDFDGINVEITVRMADKFNNPVADGTPAIFTTEYGRIDTSCLTGRSNGGVFQQVNGDAPPARGTCSVMWQSQAPRQPLFNADSVRTINDSDYNCDAHNGSSGPCPFDLGEIRGLRTTILVTSVGDESFVDANGNGLYDQGEAFENLPEAFLDMNEDGVYTPFFGPQCGPPTSNADCAAGGSEETFVDRNEDGVYSVNPDPGIIGAVYNGSLCPISGDGIFCSREQINVRSSQVLTLSLSAANQEILATDASINLNRVVTSLAENTPFEFFISDIFNNPPGAGTVITFSASGDCAIASPVPGTSLEVGVPSISSPGAFVTGLTINGTGAPEGGTLSVSVTDPEVDGFGGGTFFQRTYACSPTVCDDLEDPNDPTSDCRESLVPAGG